MKGKRFVMLAFIACTSILFCQSCGTGKKTTKGYTTQNEIDEKLKEYNVAGWQIQGSSRTMRVLISSTIQQLTDNPELIEITGTANNFMVISNGKEAAAANAANRYAAGATKLIRGRMENDNSLIQSLGEERDKLYAAYSGAIERLIVGELKEIYTLIRPRNDGKFDCEIHYLIDENKAKMAREEAIRLAGKDIKTDHDFGNSINKYIIQPPTFD